jgi:hypothetical protein
MDDAEIARVFELLLPLTTQPSLFRSYCLFKRQRFKPSSHHLVVVGVGPVNRIPEQRYQPRFRDDLRHPLRGKGVKQVPRACLSGYSPPPVSPPRSWEAPPVPLDALLFEEGVEELQLFGGGGLDERVLGQEVVEGGRPALCGSYDDEVGQHTRYRLLARRPLFRCAELFS